MAVFYPAGTGIGVVNVGSVITQVGVTSRTDVVAVRSAFSDLKVDGNRARPNADQSTILQNASGSVVHISQASGYTAVNLGGTIADGGVFTVVGASYPFSKSYRVIGVSGSYMVTDVQYANCTGIGTSGTFYTNQGSFDGTNQGDFIIMTNTDELAGLSNTALQYNASNSRGESLHPFGNYRSRVYSSCWECFGNSGIISPCEITTTVVTLAADQAASGVPTVILGIGLKTQAADLENPDTTGLRDPA